MIGVIGHGYRRVVPACKGNGRNNVRSKMVKNDQIRVGSGMVSQRESLLQKRRC